MNGSGVHFLRSPEMTAVTCGLNWIGLIAAPACIAGAQESGTSRPPQVINAASTARPLFDVASFVCSVRPQSLRTPVSGPGYCTPQ